MGINPEIIINKLNSSVDNVDFIYVYPNDTLKSPLNQRYLCALSVTCNNTVDKYDCTQYVKYNAELLAPVGKTGVEIFNKAQEISDVFLNMSTEINKIRCTIGDIVYSKTKRGNTVNIECEFILSDDCKKISVIIDNYKINSILLSESESRTSCNIMSYGSSKPVDTLLENNVYKLRVRILGGTLGELPADKSFLVQYNFGAITVVYSDCVVDKCTISVEGNQFFREYDITAYKKEWKNDEWK